MEKENESTEEIIIRMFEKWIESFKPGNSCFQTSAGNLSIDQMLKQIEEKTVWGAEFVTIIKQKFIGACLRVRSPVRTIEDREKYIFSLVSESIRRLMSFPALSRK